MGSWLHNGNTLFLYESYLNLRVHWATGFSWLLHTWNGFIWNIFTEDCAWVIIRAINPPPSVPVVCHIPQGTERKMFFFHNCFERIYNVFFIYFYINSNNRLPTSIVCLYNQILVFYFFIPLSFSARAPLLKTIQWAIWFCHFPLSSEGRNAQYKHFECNLLTVRYRHFFVCCKSFLKLCRDDHKSF